jgi:hypothetical protein
MSEYSDLGDLVTFRPLERASSQSGGRLSPFRAGWSDTVGLLADELRHHGARQVVLEVDIREKDIRVDGLPRANAIAQSPIVILSFTATQIPGKPQLRYEARRNETSVYRCPRCGGWHLTSHPRGRR